MEPARDIACALAARVYRRDMAQRGRNTTMPLRQQQITNKDTRDRLAAVYADWMEAMEELAGAEGREAVVELIRALRHKAYSMGIRLPFSAKTPYANTIPADDQPPYPGDRELERIIKSVIRWNAMAMVVRANRESDGIGGHISTFASAATLYEVGFNHFFRAPSEEYGGDLIYFQGHAAPGIYARAFLEGRLSERQLTNFRRELSDGGGLSSYPHPWLMPDFWQFPTVSMGLGPIMAIYQARFLKYLEHRGLKPANGGKVWCFVGDGETGEPETLGAIELAARENLDNLIFIINCNLQRLDGPVRGNGKIIQELEGVFRGAGWNALKVIWGSDWDPLFELDDENLLLHALGHCVDGEFQKFSVSSGDYIRKKLIEHEPRLADIMDRFDISDEALRRLKRGGHDPVKVYTAYDAAVKTEGQPTVILAKTIKGYGLGESGEGKNITHQQKKLNEDELREFRGRFGIPISDDDVAFAPFYKPPEDSPAMLYLRERRKKLGGSLPARRAAAEPLSPPPESFFEEFYTGNDRAVSTTMVFVKILAKMLRDKEFGRQVVPIVPDEARTFGMDGLFRQVGIYASSGQLYEPVDREALLYYRESTDGQILEEGITEAGGMSSFIAAGSAYSTCGVNMIPFYIFYSMFGMQRIGDLVWAAADMRCRGFLVGGTAGRTTLAGEGLQHQDGNSHHYAMAYPTLRCYDPAFPFEMAVIIRDGIRRMYELQEPGFYYLTVENENYPMPAMPDRDVKEGIIRGMYKFRISDLEKPRAHAQLVGSGAILNEALKAADRLENDYNIAADVWSATSYQALRQDGMDVERWNLLHPGEAPKKPYVTACLENEKGPVVAASDYLKALPDTICRWVPGKITSLGCDGFGRSESRENLRGFFEVDDRFITLAALHALARRDEIEMDVVKKAMQDMDIDPEKANPMHS
jgi:pyruvate dehydrogenase E1 component